MEGIQQREFSAGGEFSGGNSVEGIQQREFGGGNSAEGIRWREFSRGNSVEGIQQREFGGHGKNQGIRGSVGYYSLTYWYLFCVYVGGLLGGCWGKKSPHMT